MTGTIQTLRAVARDTSNLLGEQLRPLGLTVPQHEFLAVLATNPDYSGAQAARACHITPQTGTILLQNLTAQGLITATWIQGTGRRHTITVTDAGHEVLAKANAIAAQVEAKVAKRLGEIACRKLQAIHGKPTPAPKARKKVAPQVNGITVGRYAANVHERCRTWAADTATPDFVPEHIAHLFGTTAQVEQLVATGAWKTDGTGYRIG